jgi:hypothetical protein
MPGETYIKADFRAHLELLKPDGFTLNSDDEFEKTISNGKIFIVCRGNEYFPHSFRFGSVLAKIRFANVEDKFAQACTATSNATYSADEDDSTFGKGFAEDIIGEAGFDTLYDNEVEDDFSFQIVRPLLEQMRDAALSWADQNDTLQKAYDNAEALTLDARSNLYSQPFPNKYLIIKKLLNKTDFQDYFDELIDFYTNDEPDTNEVLFLNAQKTILDAL